MNHFLIATIIYICMMPAAYTKASREPSFPYISGDGFRAHANFIFDSTNSTLQPEQIRPGNSIFVETDLLDRFFSQIHPRITAPYILITHNSDYPSPGKWAHMLDDTRIIAWFGQNTEQCKHPKLHPIPIGITNQYHAYGNVASFNQVRAKLPTIKKKHLLYMNFSLTTHPTERQLVYNIFAKKPFCFIAPKAALGKYLEDVAASYFVLSPRGNGLDCHRTWEALLMGAYPIVKSSLLDPLFEDLPVVIVQDWNEITKEFLDNKLEEFKQHTFNMDKAYLAYWLNVIEKAKPLHS